MIITFIVICCFAQRINVNGLVLNFATTYRLSTWLRNSNCFQFVN